MRLLLNGYLDQLMYERGRLVGDESQGLPYDEMRGQHYITEDAQKYQGDPNFFGQGARAPAQAREVGALRSPAPRDQFRSRPLVRMPWKSSVNVPSGVAA
jgi:hypothetical protein